MQLIEADVGDPARQRLEDFIAERYLASFGVRPPQFAPLLIALAGRDRRILAACGLRAADDGFFSEQYVDGPIEQAVSDVLGRDIARHQLFEITTMVSVSATGLRAAVTAAVAFGRRQRCRASLFTATAELRALLARHGIVAHSLVSALPAKVGDAAAWGRYYEHDPTVCVADQPPFESVMRRPRILEREGRAVA